MFDPVPPVSPVSSFPPVPPVPLVAKINLQINKNRKLSIDLDIHNSKVFSSGIKRRFLSGYFWGLPLP